MVLMTKYIMIIIQDKMEIKQNEIRRKNPINRNNLFYSEEDFQFEKEIAKDYLEQDLNTTVILFEVDLENTNVDESIEELTELFENATGDTINISLSDRTGKEKSQGGRSKTDFVYTIMM